MTENSKKKKALEELKYEDELKEMFEIKYSDIKNELEVENDWGKIVIINKFLKKIDICLFLLNKAMDQDFSSIYYGTLNDWEGPFDFADKKYSSFYKYYIKEALQFSKVDDQIGHLKEVTKIYIEKLNDLRAILLIDLSYLKPKVGNEEVQAVDVTNGRKTAGKNRMKTTQEVSIHDLKELLIMLIDQEFLTKDCKNKMNVIIRDCFVRYDDTDYNYKSVGKTNIKGIPRNYSKIKLIKGKLKKT